MAPYPIRNGSYPDNVRLSRVCRSTKEAIWMIDIEADRPVGSGNNWQVCYQMVHAAPGFVSDLGQRQRNRQSRRWWGARERAAVSRGCRRQAGLLSSCTRNAVTRPCARKSPLPRMQRRQLRFQGLVQVGQASHVITLSLDLPRMSSSAINDTNAINEAANITNHITAYNCQSSDHPRRMLAVIYRISRFSVSVSAESWSVHLASLANLARSRWRSEIGLTGSGKSPAASHSSVFVGFTQTTGDPRSHLYFLSVPPYTSHQYPPGP